MKKDDGIKSKKIITITTIAILIVLIGVTYAALQYQREGEKENVITTGVLKINLSDNAAEGLEISPAIPQTEEQGLENSETYKFTLHNTGTGNAKYRIMLVDDEEAYEEDDCTTNRLDHNFLKAAITKDSQDEEITLLGENDDVIDEGVIEAGDSTEYTLKIWLDESADNSVGGTHFHGKIKLEGIVAGRSNYETGE